MRQAEAYVTGHWYAHNNEKKLTEHADDTYAFHALAATEMAAQGLPRMSTRNAALSSLFRSKFEETNKVYYNYNLLHLLCIAVKQSD